MTGLIAVVDVVQGFATETVVDAEPKGVVVPTLLEVDVTEPTLKLVDDAVPAVVVLAALGVVSLPQAGTPADSRMTPTRRRAILVIRLDRHEARLSDGPVGPLYWATPDEESPANASTAALRNVRNDAASPT